MNKRILCVSLGTLFLALYVSAQAQQPGKIWRIGIFHVGLDHTPAGLDPLRQQLKVLGYEQGKNIHLDWRNLPDEEAARDAAKGFVRNRVDLIVAFENQTARAAKAATSDIPIVFVSTTEPVVQGFVKSFAHPEGNITGFVGWGELYSKEMELFKEIVPRLHRLLVLIDPQDPKQRGHWQRFARPGPRSSSNYWSEKLSIKPMPSVFSAHSNGVVWMGSS